ncbi:MAG: alpha-galactosidase [Bacteroidales bacterium]|nr:alpha-galactosidase [Bacteroidales bacterium]
MSRSVFFSLIALCLCLPPLGCSQGQTPAAPAPDDAPLCIPHDSTSVYVLTPPAPAEPRINGPRVYGNRPGTPFLFKIPATGDRPMHFAAKGLPRGLRLDARSGIISGCVRKAGSYRVELIARNALGENRRELRIEIGERLSLTPPLGWNSWNCWRMSVSQEKMRQSADALLALGLDRYGWSYVNIDEGWQFDRPGADAPLQPNDKFPDMKGLADYLHGRGLKFGIYSSPWIMCPGGSVGSSSSRPDGTSWWVEEGQCNEYHGFVKPGGYGPGEWDAYRYHGRYLHMDTDARQWADWGVDFLKYDWHPNDYFSIRTMHEALEKSGRSIVYSLSNRAPIGLGDAYLRLSNAWRTSSDITDEWRNIYRIGFTVMDRWAAYTGPGHWPDADMLEIGRVADPKRPGQTRPCRLTPDEQYTHITLWAILCSPLLIGCDLSEMDALTYGLLTNSEVLDVNQDPLGYPAARVREEGACITYHKPLEDGSLVVALFNTGEAPARVGFGISEIDYMMVEPQTVRDLWRQQDLQTLEPGGGRFETELPPHGCRLLKLSPGLNYAQGIWWKDKK